MNAAENSSYFFAGEQIAGFQLIHPLRIRTLSESWYAVRRRDGSPAAIKFLRREHPRIPQFYDMADFLMRHRSPFLIAVLECAETAQQMPYAAMEYATGGTLRQPLGKGRILPLAEAVRLLRSMLLALDVLHRGGIVHRDVKPENIWFAADGAPRLGDFGLAKLPNFPEESGKVFGTAAYMSPEQAQDSTTVDCRSDLYSLALVLFEVLTGKRFRPKNSFPDTLKQILSDRSEPPVELLREAATEKLALLLGRMMEYSAALRPRSAAEALAELDAMSLPVGE